jgi:hypothetical protein
MNDTIELQTIESAEFDDELSDEARSPGGRPHLRPWQLLHGRPLSVRRRLAP